MSSYDTTTLDAPPDQEPVPIILNCPACGRRHVDAGEWATRPHKTHACQNCGLAWMPALVPTVGALFLPGMRNEGPKDVFHVTQGFKDHDPDAIAQNFAEDVMKAQAARAALLRSGYGFGDAAKEPDDVAARMTETIGKMEAAAESQQVIDAKRREMARDICRVRRQHVTNIDQAMQFAENWIVTAAQHAANEEYWRERAMRAEAAAKVPVEDPKQKNAALGLIQDEQGRILMVWNHRYSGWALPGGKVEPGETLYEALRRELEEEICIVPEQPCVCIHEGKGNVDPSVDVHVFSVTVYQGIIDQGEPSGPIMWADKAALLVGPFADFYVDMFAKLARDAKAPPPP